MKQKKHTISIARISFTVVCVALTVLCFSCEQKNERQKNYYSVDSLINAQIKYLASVKATLEKEARLGKNSIQVSLTPDSAVWFKELDVLRQLEEINKPINRGAYQITDRANDPKSNLQIKTFVGTSNQSVPYLNLYYLGSLSKLRKIEALYQEENNLYRSARVLTMEFQDIKNKNVLTSYTIDGGQKMFLGDSVDFSIRGKIKIN